MIPRVRRIAPVVVLVLAAACGGHKTPKLDAGTIVAKRVIPEYEIGQQCVVGQSVPKMPGLTVCTYWQTLREGPFYVLTVNECEIPQPVGCRVQDIRVDPTTFSMLDVGQRWTRS